MKLIPPTRKTVPAGFSVFKAGDNPEVFLYIESGELAALVEGNENSKNLFTAKSGDLIGVPSLLEKQPLPYSLQAIEETTYLEIDEECLASVLKSTPVWLLAAIRQTTQQTKKAKKSSSFICPGDTTKALSAFLLQKAEISKAQGESPIFENYLALLKECAWLTRIPLTALKEELFSLERKRLVLIHENELGIQEPLLLQALVEYHTAIEQGKEYPPFHFNLVEKRAIHCVSRQGENVQFTESTWLEILQSNDKFATISEVKRLEQLSLLKRTDTTHLRPNSKQINKYLLCFEYEKEIKGVAL